MVDKVAVVTGAAGHIGRVLVEALSARGYRVTGLDLPAACPDDPRFIGCDLTDDHAVEAAMSDFERIDLLVLSAGLSAIGSLGEHDIDVHRKVMDVTHFAAVSVTLAALPALRRAAGRIVLVGSVAGFAPVLGRPPYVAAKHAVTGLFTAVRPELADAGVSLTIVHPTFVAGGMTEVSRSPDAQRLTSGAELDVDDVVRALLDGIDRGRDVVLVGKTARQASLISRLAPRLYMRLMLRRLRGQEKGAA